MDDERQQWITRALADGTALAKPAQNHNHNHNHAKAWAANHNLNLMALALARMADGGRALHAGDDGQ